MLTDLMNGISGDRAALRQSLRRSASMDEAGAMHFNAISPIGRFIGFCLSGTWTSSTMFRPDSLPGASGPLRSCGLAALNSDSRSPVRLARWPFSLWNSR